MFSYLCRAAKNAQTKVFFVSDVQEESLVRVAQTLLQYKGVCYYNTVP